MIKIFKILVVSLFILLSPMKKSEANLINVSEMQYSSISGGATMQKLSNDVLRMAKQISKASADMMKFGDMLFCSSIYGKAAYWEFSVLNWEFKEKVLAVELFFSSLFLIAIGFMVSMIAAFYMFDIAFNLSISIVLLPLGIALWPFGWTRDKLKTIIGNIVYYIGLFIFLPLGILIGMAIINEIVMSIFGGANELEEAFRTDNADFIEDNLSLFTLTFLKVLLSYVVALRVLPLMASEFCGHFFKSSFAGNPIDERLSQMLSKVKQKTIGRVANYGKDVASYQINNLFQKK